MNCFLIGEIKLTNLQPINRNLPKILFLNGYPRKIFDLLVIVVPREIRLLLVFISAKIYNKNGAYESAYFIAYVKNIELIKVFIQSHVSKI